MILCKCFFVAFGLCNDFLPNVLQRGSYGIELGLNSMMGCRLVIVCV